MKKVLTVIGLEIIYFVILFGCMFLGFLDPALWIYQPVLATFLAATPVLIICKNWSKFGAVIILPGIYAIVMILMGEFSGVIPICSLIVILALAEIVRYFIGYDNKQGARMGYAIVGLLPALQMLPLWLDKESYYAGAAEEMGSVSYAEGLMTFANPIGLIALIILTLCAGYLGAIVSEKVFKTKTTI